MNDVCDLKRVTACNWAQSWIPGEGLLARSADIRTYFPFEFV